METVETSSNSSRSTQLYNQRNCHSIKWIEIIRLILNYARKSSMLKNSAGVEGNHCEMYCCHGYHCFPSILRHTDRALNQVLHLQICTGCSARQSVAKTTSVFIEIYLSCFSFMRLCVYVFAAVLVSRVIWKLNKMTLRFLYIYLKCSFSIFVHVNVKVFQRNGIINTANMSKLRWMTIAINVLQGCQN